MVVDITIAKMTCIYSYSFCYNFCHWKIPKPLSHISLYNVLMWLDLKFADARGRCYDSATTILGIKSGIAVHIKSQNGKWLYTHYANYFIWTIAVSDIIKNEPRSTDMFHSVKEISKVVRIYT